MNIAYFSNQFASASGHGIAHYAHRLYEGLNTYADFNIIPIATGSDRNTTNLKQLKKKTRLQILPGGRKLLPLAWTFLNKPSIENFLPQKIDLTHIVSLGFPVATTKKLVVTVHDIGPITHPEYFKKSKPYLFKLSFEHMVKYADAIICVSQATADEVVSHGGEHLSNRIHVIHEGVDRTFFSKKPLDPYPEIPNLPSSNTPFFLAAGAISPRKNIKRLIEAYLQVHRTIPHHLVLVGGNGWDCSEVNQLVQTQNLAEKIHLLGYVSDDQLQSLYKHADFYIHPSLFEGFGLTILEAMAAGCPVITSNRSSLAEIAGDAAVLIDPCNTQEIASAISSYAQDNALRQQYIHRGLDHVKAFDWSDTAAQVANVYRTIN